jgi:hypothetical protein
VSADAAVRDLAEGRFAAALPAALGGIIVFQPPASGVLRFE